MGRVHYGEHELAMRAFDLTFTDTAESKYLLLIKVCANHSRRFS